MRRREFISWAVRPPLGRLRCAWRRPSDRILRLGEGNEPAKRPAGIFSAGIFHPFQWLDHCEQRSAGLALVCRRRCESTEKFHDHCQQQQAVSHPWIACLRSGHFSLFICRCSEGEQARHVCRAGISEPDAGHNSYAAQHAESQHCLLDSLRSARRYRSGR